MIKAAHLPVTGGGSSGGISLGTPDAIQHLREPLRGIVLESFTRALEMVFLAAIPAAIIAFLVVLLIREVPLRSARDYAPVTQAAPGSGPAAVAAGTPAATLPDTPAAATPAAAPAAAPVPEEAAAGGGGVRR